MAMIPPLATAPVAVVAIAAAVAVIAALALGLRLRGAGREARQLVALRELASEDVDAFERDVSALELRLPASGNAGPASGNAATEQARSHLRAARLAFSGAQRPQQIELVTAELAAGWRVLAAAAAALDGRRPPSPSPPCFFDPAHGPSDREVSWAPDGADARPVPACAADARRLERGEAPAARQVLLGGRPTAYWNAPGFYGPWFAGHFGGADGALAERLLIGTLLGGGMGYEVDQPH